MMTRRVGLCLILMVIAGIALLRPAVSSQSAKLEVDEVQVGILPIALHAPVFAAQELGYFNEEGLKVVTQFGQGGAALLPLVIQGQMQIGNVPISTALQARANNLDVVMIGPGTYVAKSQPPDQTATIVKSNSNIHTLRDLGGKKVAVNVINSVNWLYNRAMLQKAGVDLKTVTYVEVPFPNMIDAVVNGYVDAAATSQPFLYFGQKSGKVKVLAYDFLEVQPGAQISGFAVSRKWAQSNPHTLAAFERGVARGVDYLRSDPAKAASIIAKFSHVDAKVIEGAGIPSWVNELSVANIEAQMQLMIKYGLLQKPQDIHDLIWADSSGTQK